MTNIKESVEIARLLDFNPQNKVKPLECKELQEDNGFLYFQLGLLGFVILLNIYVFVYVC